MSTTDQRQCSVCDRPHYAKGLCRPHYRRQARHGDVFADVAISTAVRGQCSVPGCTHPIDARGWCHGHFQRWLRNGDVQPEIPLGRRRQPEICRLEDCGRASQAKGLCGPHYTRSRKNGDPRPDVAIRIVTGEGGLSHGYWKVRVPQALRHLTNGANSALEHRLVMAQHLQRPLHPGEVVHHINGVRTDNRIENLELWSTTQPKGQRVDEKVAWAKELLRLYEPDALVGREREAAP